MSIDGQGKVFLNTQPVTIEALGQQLSDWLSRDAELTVQFNVDSAVNYGTVAQVMAVVQRAGITKLSLLHQEQ